MSYDLIKAAARHAGLYRHARWTHRHVMNRAELRTFRLTCDLYRPFIRPGDLCFDVGANYGARTEVFLALGANVVAFEPQQDCCEEIRARNPRATVICSAMGAAAGTAVLYVDHYRTGSSLLSTWRAVPERQINVPVTTIDSAIQTYGPPHFCKIDVEGFELEVLRGLTRPIAVLSYEFHRHRIPDALACLDYLERFGPFDVNLTSKDDPVFVSHRWFDAEEARRFFGHTLPEWGDVFVRLKKQ